MNYCYVDDVICNCFIKMQLHLSNKANHNQNMYSHKSQKLSADRINSLKTTIHFSHDSMCISMWRSWFRWLRTFNVLNNTCYYFYFTNFSLSLQRFPVGNLFSPITKNVLKSPKQNPCCIANFKNLQVLCHLLRISGQYFLLSGALWAIRLPFLP